MEVTELVAWTEFREEVPIIIDLLVFCLGAETVALNGALLGALEGEPREEG